MTRRLFLTGDMGIGKSTAIAAALGDALPSFGGFLTRRNLGTDGRVCSFSIATPDGREEQVFLDFSSGKPEIHLEAFETLGVSALEGNALILDEIGGVELLSPVFVEALRQVLKRDIPILGVLKGPAPASALIQKLGLTDTYREEAEKLFALLSRDEGTTLYSCGKYEEEALILARAWVKEYAHGQLF